jgi:hypothetical protein
MNAINDCHQSHLLIAFMGTTLVSPVVAGSFFWWGRTGGTLSLAAASSHRRRWRHDGLQRAAERSARRGGARRGALVAISMWTA